MSLQDSGRMTQMICSENESYIDLTILLHDAIDYDKEKFMIGIDTYQRNNGEYLYQPGDFATSLAGIKFLIIFESNRSASLCVIPSYNRNKRQFSSVASNQGSYDYICPLKYGGFERTPVESIAKHIEITLHMFFGQAMIGTAHKTFSVSYHHVKPTQHL